MPKITHYFIKYLTPTVAALIPIAACASGNTPVSEGLGYITTAMFGSTGIILATLAIMAVGLMCLFHVLEWKRLIQTVAGIAIIFGASGIVSGIQTLVTQ